MKWHKIAEEPEDIFFNQNNLAEVNAGGKTICVGKNGERWYAFTQKCPHAGGFMVEGYIDSSNHIVCPLHRYKFNLNTGRNAEEGYYLKTYAIELRPNGIFVEL